MKIVKTEGKSIKELTGEVNTYWGDKMPMMAMEELAELAQAISKFERNPNSVDAQDNFLKECADVYISIAALMHRYELDPSDILDKVDEKLNKKYDE